MVPPIVRIVSVAGNQNAVIVRSANSDIGGRGAVVADDIEDELHSSPV